MELGSTHAKLTPTNPCVSCSGKYLNRIAFMLSPLLRKVNRLFKRVVYVARWKMQDFIAIFFDNDQPC